MKNSARYLAGYILVWFVFPFIYYFLGGQFYHSSIQREPAYIEQQKDFKLRLNQYLDKQLRSDSFSQMVIRDSAGTVIPFRVEAIAIDKVKQIDDDELVTTASLALITTIEKVQPQRANWSYIANITFSIRNWKIFEKDYWMINSIQIKKVVANPDTYYREQIQGLRYPLESDPDMQRITFNDEITGYASATFGQPKPSIDNLVRMFYLSSMTITTTGYGDIVPLTNWARFWVAVEAFLGITIMGFFLNSIAQEIIEVRREKYSKDDEKYALSYMAMKYG